jgi:MipA family protein
MMGTTQMVVQIAGLSGWVRVWVWVWVWVRVRVRVRVWALALAMQAGPPALAAPGGPPLPKEAKGWSVSAGAAYLNVPRAVGSSSTLDLVVPNFALRYDDWFFADPFRGIGLQGKLTDGLSATMAQGAQMDSRRESDDPRYAGLGDVRFVPALQLGLEYEIGRVVLASGISRRLGQRSQRGSLLNVDLGFKLLVLDRGNLALGYAAKAMDNEYARNFFAVSAQQSAASGLPVYAAGSGVYRSGPFAQGVWRINKEWTLLSRLELDELRGDAAGSPIVQRKNQRFFVTSVVVSY